VKRPSPAHAAFSRYPALAAQPPPAPDRALTANGGLAAISELCDRLGVIGAIDAAAGPVKQRTGASCLARETGATAADANGPGQQ
jgi:hypothetical protein